MHMISHQYPRMYFDLIVLCVVFKPIYISYKILLAGKAHLSIITTLDNMLGNSYRALELILPFVLPAINNCSAYQKYNFTLTPVISLPSTL